MKPFVHATAGAVATAKQAILYAMWVWIPAMAITGGSGFSLAGGRSGRLVASKSKRMRFIALNGLLIMLPAAFFLFRKAAAGEFDTVFYVVQAAELLVGAAQLVLMGVNFRDGLKFAGRLRPA